MSHRKNPSDFMLHPAYYLVLVQKTENSSSDIQPNDDENDVQQENRRIHEIHDLRVCVLMLLCTFYFGTLCFGICFTIFPKKPEDTIPGGPFLITAVVVRLIIFLCINHVWGIGDRLRPLFFKHCKLTLGVVCQTLSNTDIVIGVLAGTAVFFGVVGFMFVLFILFDEEIARGEGNITFCFVICAVAAVSLMVKGVPLRICEYMGYVSVPPTMHT